MKNHRRLVAIVGAIVATSVSSAAYGAESQP